MVLARSLENPNSILPSLGNRGNKLVLLGFVESVISKTSRTAEMIE